MSEKKFMRQGNMVGKFKVDIGTVYDNFGTFPNPFTFGPWGLIAFENGSLFPLLVEEFSWFLFFGDGALVFLLCRTGSLHRRSNDLISVEMCDFAIWGLLCEFWKFFRSCNASSWEQGSLSEALSWMLPPLCHNKVRLIDSAQKLFWSWSFIWVCI